MDREELVRRFGDTMSSPEHSLTREKVEERATNVRDYDSYVLFDIERHPGAGESQLGKPHTTIETWRCDKESNAVEHVCEFDHMYTIEQNEEGEPVCRSCEKVLDLHEEVYGYIWRCFGCGAIGGKEEEIFDPSIGEPLGEREAYNEIGDGLWIPED